MDNPEAKRPSYSINYGGMMPDIMSQFSDVALEHRDKDVYLTAWLKGKKVRELMLRLDAERVEKGELVPQQLLGKYFSYLIENQ